MHSFFKERYFTFIVFSFDSSHLNIKPESLCVHIYIYKFDIINILLAVLNLIWGYLTCLWMSVHLIQMFLQMIMTTQRPVSYQQIPGSLLRGSAYKGRSGIWEYLWEPCRASHKFLLGLCEPTQLSPFLHPGTETQEQLHSFSLIYQSLRC